jgi:hypothetical protein
MKNITAGLLILGSVLFVLAAFQPLTVSVVTETDIVRRTQALEDGKTAWLFVNILFGTGSILAAIGLTFFTLYWHRLETFNSNLKVLSYFVPILFTIATILWLLICGYRVLVPAQEVANNLIVNSWLFLAYTLLSQIALILLGIVLIQSNYPVWMARWILLLAVLSLLAYFIFQDMPPFAHYVILFLTGIGLLRTKPRKEQQL